MNFNDIFYTPKRESEYSVKHNRRRYIAFLTSLVLVLSLSSDVSSTLSKKRTTKDKITELEILSSVLQFYSATPEERDNNLTVVSNTEDIEEKSEISVQEPAEKEKILVNEPADFARYIRDLLKDIPNEVKYNYILEHFKHTPEQFDEMQAVICNEAKPKDETGNRYVDAFSAINSVYNRMCSKTKCGYAKIWLKKDSPISMYDHIVAPGQYQPYGDGTYKKYLGHTTSCTDEAYQAVLDFLYIADKGYGYMTDKMDFMASGQGYDDSEIYVLGGNEFRNPLTLKDTIPLEERYYMINEEVIIDEVTEPNEEVSIDETMEVIENSEEDITVQVIGEIPENIVTSEVDETLDSDISSPVIVIQEDFLDETYVDENTLTLQR